MSESIAVEFEGVGKMYRLYKNRKDAFLDITGMKRLTPWRSLEVDNFWALRDVSIRLPRGSRLGIVGRNGAGKTTLLKLMTSNVSPTEGRVKVHGEVRALLDAGAGFHPEFSGYENIEASLTHYGLSRSQIDQAIEDIAEFTELGEFLRQPFKNYSAGMQARLVFTTATAIKPDILIIDEILGAGDAYFAIKSRGRMKQLVESGASVLLVSHSLDQILQFCDQSIWLERGRILARGPSLEVVKAYQEFIHVLQDRRLRTVNRDRAHGFRDPVNVDAAPETFVVVLTLEGEPGARLDLSRVELRANGLAEETLRLGDTQDSDTGQLSYVALPYSEWGDPESDGSVNFRSIDLVKGGSAQGEMGFRSFGLEEEKQYCFGFRYRLHGQGRVRATLSRNGRLIASGIELPTEGSDWTEHEVDFKVTARPRDTESEKQEGNGKDVSEDSQSRSARSYRWPGSGALMIDKVVLTSADGHERAVIKTGTAVDFTIHYRAKQEGTFPVISALVIYRPDGVMVTQHVSPPETVTVLPGDIREAKLHFPALDLADGRYVISCRAA